MGVSRAVKIVERRQFADERPFEREFRGIQRYEPVSRSADGLVHVLHVGRPEAAGYFYYVMELAGPSSPAAGRGSGSAGAWANARDRTRPGRFGRWQPTSPGRSGPT